jgi:hypothetical protein
MITLKLTKKEMFLIISALDDKAINEKNYLSKPDIDNAVKANREKELMQSEELGLKIWSELISN